MESIEDRVYIVTGGGGAIARPILGAFAAAGAKLVAVDRAAAPPSVGDLQLAADLAKPEGAEAVVRETLARFGRLDGLVHTVGGFAMARVQEAPSAQYDLLFDLNVRTLFHCVRAVLPTLVAQKTGFVAAFSSDPGWNGVAGPGMALYGAAKSAVATFLHSLDGELAGTDVRVAIVYPMGAVDTPANRRDMPAVDPATFIDPTEIAETLVFAASRGPRGRLMDLPIWPPRRPA